MPNARSAEEKRKVDDRRLHLTPKEANQLIEAAGKRGRYPERDRIMVRLVYRHGLRASEACDLRWDQLNLDEGTITVRRYNTLDSDLVTVRSLGHEHHTG